MKRGRNSTHLLSAAFSPLPTDPSLCCLPRARIHLSQAFEHTPHAAEPGLPSGVGRKSLGLDNSWLASVHPREPIWRSLHCSHYGQAVEQDAGAQTAPKEKSLAVNALRVSSEIRHQTSGVKACVSSAPHSFLWKHVQEKVAELLTPFQ